MIRYTGHIKRSIDENEPWEDFEFDGWGTAPWEGPGSEGYTFYVVDEHTGTELSFEFTRAQLEAMIAEADAAVVRHATRSLSVKQLLAENECGT